MQNRTNDKFDRIVNKGLMLNKFKGYMDAKKMMENAGLPSDIIHRVLGEQRVIRRSDWN